MRALSLLRSGRSEGRESMGAAVSGWMEWNRAWEDRGRQCQGGPEKGLGPGGSLPPAGSRRVPTGHFLSGSRTSIRGSSATNSSGTKAIRIPQPAWTVSIRPKSRSDNSWSSIQMTASPCSLSSM